jgi:hypothetical protein
MMSLGEYVVTSFKSSDHKMAPLHFKANGEDPCPKIED